MKEPYIYDPERQLAVQIEAQIRQAGYASSFRPDFLTDGRASFNPRDVGVFGSVALKSSRTTHNTGTVLRSALPTLWGEATAAWDSNTVQDFPLNMSEGNAVLDNGFTVPVEQLSGSQFFDAMNPQERILFLQSGYSGSNFSDVKTLGQATMRFRNIASSIERDQRIEEFNSTHKGWAFATSLAAFAAEVATDPTSYIGFGSGALFGTTTKIGAKQAAKQLGKEAATSRLGLPAVLSAGSRAGDDLMGTIVTSTATRREVVSEMVDADGTVRKVVMEVVEDRGDYQSVRVVRILDNEDTAISPTSGRPNRRSGQNTLDGRKALPESTRSLPGVDESGRLMLPEGRPKLNPGSGTSAQAKADEYDELFNIYRQDYTETPAEFKDSHPLLDLVDEMYEEYSTWSTDDLIKRRSEFGDPSNAIKDVLNDRNVDVEDVIYLGDSGVESKVSRESAKKAESATPPEHKKPYFPKSKVVKEDGTPAYGYHGTSFKGSLDRLKASRGEHDYGEGIYLTLDPATGQRYADLGERTMDDWVRYNQGEKAGSGIVRKFEIDIKNPIYTDEPLPDDVIEAAKKIAPNDEDWQDSVKWAAENKETPIDLGLNDYHKRWTKAYKNAGYDGIIEIGGDEQVVVFSNKQLKEIDAPTQIVKRSPNRLAKTSKASPEVNKEHGLVVRTTNDLVKPPGKEIMTVGKAFAEDGVDVRRMKKVRNTAGEGLVVVPKSWIVPATSAAPSLRVLSNEATRQISRTRATLLGVGEGAIYDVMSQWSEFVHRKDELGMNEDFKYDYLRGGLSAVMIAGLTNLGAFTYGRRPAPMTVSDVVSTSPTSTIGLRYGNLITNRSVGAKAQADLVEVMSYDVADKFIRAAFTDTQARDLQSLLLKYKAANDDYSDLGEFFSKIPTYLEAVEFLTGVSTSTETAASVLKRRILERANEIRVASAAGNEADVAVLRRLQSKDKADYERLKSEFEFREADPDGRLFSSILNDSPQTDLYGSRDSRMRRIRDLITNNLDELRKSNDPVIKKASYSLFKGLAVLGSQGTTARQAAKLDKMSEDPLAQLMAKIIGAYDPRVANQFFTHLDGSSVRSVHDNMVLNNIRLSAFENEVDTVLRNVPQERREAIYREVMEIRGGAKKLSEASQEAARLYKPLASYLDDIGVRGLDSGYLKNAYPNYMPILLKSQVSSAQLDTLSQLLAKFWRQGRFSDESTTLHRASLFNMKIVNDAGELTADSPYKSVPTKKSELTPDDLARYNEQLDQSLLDEASNAVTRRQGRTVSTEDAMVRNDQREVKYRIDNRVSRSIEQEFWLSKEVMDLGVLDMDLPTIMRNYRDTIGVGVARAETWKEIAGGEFIRPGDLFDGIEEQILAKPDTDPTKTILLDALTAVRTLDARTTNFQSKSDAAGLEKIIQPGRDFAAGTINQGMILTQTPEIVATLLPRLFKSHDIKMFFRMMRDVFKSNLNNSELRAFGFTSTLESGNSRFWGSDSINPSSMAGTAMRGYRDWTHKWMGQQAITGRLQRFRYNSTYYRSADKLFRIGDKITKLQASVDPNDTAAFKSVARAAGFGSDVALARDYRRLGLHTDSAQRALARYKELGKDVLRNPHEATKAAIRESNPELRADMIKLSESLGILAREDADRVIVQRSAGTALPDDSIFATTVLQFLTYPAGWFNNFLRRTSQGKNSVIAGYLGAYFFSEAFVIMMRDVAKEGDRDKVLEDWQENWDEKMFLIAARLPMAGPWTDIAISPIASLLTGQRTRFGLSSNPAYSFAEQVVGAGTGTVRSLVKGETPSDSDVRTLLRNTPLVGSPPIQYLIQGTE